jgi:ATP-dependent RNA helicase DDX23/PRP28
LPLPPNILGRVAEDGPLALVVAPARELALQIHGEFQKLLSRQDEIKTTCCILGGQPIQQQAQELRQGVHVVVGTPGRMNDCTIEMAYLVLNQCCYIVLDEADRMIDMGFAPQMESILDAMGGLLKSENETEVYRQEEDDLKDLENSGALPRHRLTAMFSATMPLEVERIAKRYLRHPAVISIGDQDSSRNARIVQRGVFVAGLSKKESALRECLLTTMQGGGDAFLLPSIVVMY